MKHSIKKLLLSPFRLVDRLSNNKSESLLIRCAHATFSDGAKMRFSKQTLIDLVARKNPEKRFKIGSYINALVYNSSLADRFAVNLIDKLTLYESQLGQDCIVDTIFDGKTNGVFVEVGVGDGKNISNTYYLEKCRNWTGVLCEPSTKFHDSVRKNRKAKLVTHAVYNQSGLELGFSEVIGSEELSTLSDQEVSDTHDRSKTRDYLVTTIAFNELYERHLNNMKIDYLSIDTEGSELTILKAIDFDKIDISVISVEHSYNKKKLNDISDHLNRYGFVEILHGVFEFDAFFVSREIRQKLINSHLL